MLISAREGQIKTPPLKGDIKPGDVPNIVAAAADARVLNNT